MQLCRSGRTRSKSTEIAEGLYQAGLRMDYDSNELVLVLTVRNEQHTFQFILSNNEAQRLSRYVADNTVNGQLTFKEMERP